MATLFVPQCNISSFVFRIINTHGHYSCSKIYYCIKQQRWKPCLQSTYIYSFAEHAVSGLFLRGLSVWTSKLLHRWGDGLMKLPGRLPSGYRCVVTATTMASRSSTTDASTMVIVNVCAVTQNCGTRQSTVARRRGMGERGLTPECGRVGTIQSLVELTHRSWASVRMDPWSLSQYVFVVLPWVYTT